MAKITEVIDTYNDKQTYNTHREYKISSLRDIARKIDTHQSFQHYGFVGSNIFNYYEVIADNKLLYKIDLLNPDNVYISPIIGNSERTKINKIVSTFHTVNKKNKRVQCTKTRLKKTFIYSYPIRQACAMLRKSLYKTIIV